MAAKGQSLWKDAWRRLRRNRFAMGGLVIVVVMTVLAAGAPWIVPFQPDYGQPWVGPQSPGYRHPAVPAEIRFDVGKVPTVPETYPAPVAETISGDGVIEYTARELAEREYRIRLRRGKVEQIKQGARSLTRLEVSGEKYLRIVGRGDELGPPVRDVVFEKKEPLPEKIEAPGRVLMLRVVEARTPEPEKIRVEIRDGSVRSIRRDVVEAKELRLDGRYVLSLTKDGEPQELFHWLGTDLDGRDVWSRVIYGGRISLMVGCVATVVSVLVGVLYGAIAGYLSNQAMTAPSLVAVLLAFLAAGFVFGAVPGGFAIKSLVAIAVFAAAVKGLHALLRHLPRGRGITTTGEFMMRVVDIVYGLPYMFLVILLMISFGRDIRILFIALGLLQWLTMARIVRGQVLSLKEKEFVEAARMSGAGHLSILLRHLIPNTLGVVVVYTTLTVPAVILQESFLAFIGLTVEYQGRTLDSWGSLVNEGRKALSSSGGNWWVLVYPSVAMALTLFSLNFLGDGLRDALDPQLKGRT